MAKWTKEQRARFKATMKAKREAKSLEEQPSSEEQIFPLALIPGPVRKAVKKSGSVTRVNGSNIQLALEFIRTVQRILDGR